MDPTAESIDWPPVYTIKKHRRAKYVKLRAASMRGLIITVPYRFNLKNIPSILEEHRSWITKHLLRIQAEPPKELPVSITFHALNETWQIRYMETQARLKIMERPAREIVLVGKMEEQACQKKLVIWLKNYAKQFLTQELQRVSERLGMTYKRVAIRDQRTVWGTCSASKVIHLNYKLLFLPRHLMINILIHELCHTQYLNHSERFWDLVATFDPHWKEHRRELRKADHYIPGWVNVK